MKRSRILEDGIYRYSFTDTAIEGELLPSFPEDRSDIIQISGGKEYYLEGTSSEDIKVVLHDPRQRRKMGGA
jgi:hypothetical protein